MSLDLEEGDEALADASPAERRRAARKATKEAEPARSKSTGRQSSRSPRASTRDRVENEILSRLDRTCERIATQLDARGDEELSQVIREDKEAIGQGLVSLTSNVKLLRGPLLMMLNMVEPLLAFGRLGRILYVRFVERQARIAFEREALQTDGAVSSPAPVIQ